MFKVNRLTSEQQSVENCFNIICWLKINHDRLQATYKITLFYQNNVNAKTLNIYFNKFLYFTSLILIVASIYCFFIKHQANQKYLLPCHCTINGLKKMELQIIIKMESNDELKEINIKKRTCYHFGDIIEFKGFNIDNILIDERL